MVQVRPLTESARGDMELAEELIWFTAVARAFADPAITADPAAPGTSRTGDGPPRAPQADGPATRR